MDAVKLRFLKKIKFRSFLQYNTPGEKQLESAHIIQDTQEEIRMFFE